jgi:hypothetical protein
MSSLKKHFCFTQAKQGMPLKEYLFKQRLERLKALAPTVA